MKLNFSDERYKKIAIGSTGYSEIESKHKISEAFLILLKGVKKEDLDNLCIKIQNDFEKQGIKLSIDECYKLTQGKISETFISRAENEEHAKKELGEYLIDLAYECIEVDGNHLGSNVIPNTSINTSSWISHSLFEAKAAKQLAECLDLDPEKAGVLGILHDYGRKYIHDFSHVTKGYETLVDAGWIDEARATITHSFINAGRCANCDPAEEGFYIDEEGKPQWKEEIEKDDVTEVLENMEYDDYDTILNIADLMATDKGITSPYERVEDVATRKTPDIRNRAYFLSEFTNKLVYIISRMNNKNNIEDELNPLMNIEEINYRFKEISQIFYETYNQMIRGKIK